VHLLRLRVDHNARSFAVTVETDAHSPTTSFPTPHLVGEGGGSPDPLREVLGVPPLLRRMPLECSSLHQRACGFTPRSPNTNLLVLWKRFSPRTLIFFLVICQECLVCPPA